MQLNDAGEMVDRIWNDIPEHYPSVGIDEHSIMPNHFHGIIILLSENVGASPRGRPLSLDQIGRRRINQVRHRGPTLRQKEYR